MHVCVYYVWHIKRNCATAAMQIVGPMLFFKVLLFRSRSEKFGVSAMMVSILNNLITFRSAHTCLYCVAY
jgi:hypothetical protein